MKNILRESRISNSEFIIKLPLTADLEKIRSEYEEFVSIGRYNCNNQLALKNRPNCEDVFLDGVGSLFDQKSKSFFAKESEFTEYNPYVGEYTKKIIRELELSENVRFGRIRYMRLPPKTGLSVHYDMEARYHLPIYTSPTSMICEYSGEALAAKCHHIPENGHFYIADTTRNHFVYNGSFEDRIHLVMCIDRSFDIYK